MVRDSKLVFTYFLAIIIYRGEVMFMAKIFERVVKNPSNDIVLSNWYESNGYKVKIKLRTTGTKAGKTVEKHYLEVKPAV